MAYQTTMNIDEATKALLDRGFAREKADKYIRESTHQLGDNWLYLFDSIDAIIDDMVLYFQVLEELDDDASMV